VKPLAEQTLYEILEVPFDAPEAEIVKAWDRVSSLYGPGSLATYTLMAPEEAALLGQRLEEALTVLLDPVERQRYDARISGTPVPRAGSGEDVSGGPRRAPRPAPLPPIIPALVTAPGRPRAAAPAVDPAPPVVESGVAESVPAPVAEPVAAATEQRLLPEVAESARESVPAEVATPPASEEVERAGPVEVEPAPEAQPAAEVLEAPPVSETPPAPALARNAILLSDLVAERAPAQVPPAPPIPIQLATPVPASPPFAAVAEAPAATPPPARVAPEPIAAPPAPAPRPAAVPEGTRFTGDVLRRAREARGISMQQMCERTKITRHHIENLEADRYEKLPVPVYLRGILMALAKELRLDGQKVARSYLEAAAEAGQPKR